MTDFKDKLHGGDFMVRQRSADEPAPGRFSYSWYVGLPTEENPNGSLTLSGTLPPDFAGEDQEPTLEGAVKAASVVVTEQLTKQYPTLLTA